MDRVDEILAELNGVTKGLFRHFKWTVERTADGHAHACFCGPSFCVRTCDQECLLCGFGRREKITPCPGELTWEQQMVARRVPDSAGILEQRMEARR